MKKNTKTIVQLFLLCACLSFQFVNAQEKVEKSNENFNVNSDVSVDVNAKQTQLIIETWNRNSVSVEAYMSSEELDKEELKALAANWQLNVVGNSNQISITSNGATSVGFPNPQGMVSTISAVSNSLIQPMLNTMVKPILMKMSNRSLPPQFYEGMSDLKFDYNAYQRDGEKYLKTYEKRLEKKFGKDTQAVMAEWSSDIEKNAEVWAQQLQERMEAVGDRQGRSMEEWGANFERQMDEWAQQFDQQIQYYTDQGSSGQLTKTVSTSPNGGQTVTVRYSGQLPQASSNRSDKEVKRVIVVKIPKEAGITLNIRHGSVDLNDAVKNIRGSVAHADFKAKSISGVETALNITYSKINIENWDYGNLDMSYVKNCLISQANNLKLTSNLSDVHIGELKGTGVIAGSFGELKIDKVGKDFRSLNINLENSDLKLQLPKTAFNINYSGARSKIDYPKSLNAKISENYGSKFLNGFRKSRDTDSSININARFSDVVLQ